MSAATPSRFTKEAMLGAADNIRGMVNVSTIAVAFVLSIMVINNYRQCRDAKGRAGAGYKKPHVFVSMSYFTAVLVLIASILLICLDLFKMFAKK
jgi:hypothetical protein